MNSPKQIKDYLDQYVIGQDEAKKVLAVSAYNHYKRITLSNRLRKSNVLMVGPTGSGKTYLVSMLAQMLEVDFIAVDATKFTASGYVGKDVDEIIFELYMACEKSLHRVSEAIVYIDEIDKIRKKGNGGGTADIGGVEVQQALLKLLEGTTVTFASSGSKIDPHDIKVNTSNIMFVCSGAFVGTNDASVDSLVNFGMIPEFLGRFSMITSLKPLTAEDMKKILLESKDSALDSLREWFETEEIEVDIHESAVDAIVEKTMLKNVGARGLHHCIDDALLNAQFEAPSFTIKPKRLILDREVIETGIPKWEF